MQLIITSNSTEGDKRHKGNKGLEKIALLIDRVKVPHLGKAALASLLNQRIQLIKPRLKSMCAAVTYMSTDLSEDELRNAIDWHTGSVTQLDERTLTTNESIG